MRTFANNQDVNAHILDYRPTQLNTTEDSNRKQMVVIILDHRLQMLDEIETDISMRYYPEDLVPADDHRFLEVMIVIVVEMKPMLNSLTTLATPSCVSKIVLVKVSLTY
jgi:hypothetical protein